MDEIHDHWTLPSAGSSRAATGEYVVVARRYRPQTFDELIGQEHVAQALGQRDSDRPRRPRLSVHRGPRRGQDIDRPHPRQGAQLRSTARRRRRATSATSASAITAGERRRRAGDRRRQQPRHRRDPATAAERQHPPQPGSVQDLHHRRSSHADERGVQRAC